MKKNFNALQKIFTFFQQKVMVYLHMSLVMRKPAFAYAKTKTQISCAVTTELISAFVFAIKIVQFLNFLNPQFQVSSHLLWLYTLVCVGPGRKPRRPVFSQRGSYVVGINLTSCHLNTSVFV